MLVAPAPAPGWTVATIRTANPGFVVAVTTADADVLQPWTLFASLRRLSPNGIVVWVSTLGRGRRRFPAHPWPPRLASFRVDRGWEGQPAANVQQRVWVGSARGWDLDVRVYFATQTPSRDLRAKARAELLRLRLPP